MASAAVQAAVATRLAGWAHIATYPALTPNELAASPRQKWLDVQYPVANEERLDLGQDGVAQYREEGGIRFVLQTLDLDGIAAELTAADDLRDRFRDAEFDGVVTFEADPPAFDKSNRNGAFFQVPFVVLYQFDYSKTRQP